MKSFAAYLFILITITANAQLYKRMELVSGLKDQDSVSFSVRHIGCRASEPDPFAYFKLVKRFSVITFIYVSDSSKIKKIILTEEQLKLFRKLEKRITSLGSTSYDEYAVNRNGKIEYRGRYMDYSKQLISFFE